MIQLSFQPALDPFHAIFRLLRMCPLVAEIGEKPVDQMRILDFYLCFPFRIGDIRLRPADRRFKKLGERYAGRTPYGEQPSDRDLFVRMKPMQLAAVDTLGSRAFLDADRLRYSWVSPTANALPPAVQLRVEQINREEADLMEFLGILATQYILSGTDGLKSRTNLMEHRYDAI